MYTVNQDRILSTYVPLVHIHVQQSPACFSWCIVFVLVNSWRDGESSEENEIATYGESDKEKEIATYAQIAIETR